MSEYRVKVAKDYLVFSAAHFITYNGNVCERLHGHNYQVEVEVGAPLDDNHYVVDFIFLRDTAQAIVMELDHRMLLPTEHSMIRVQPSENEVLVTFEDRRWVFPRQDCLLLPIANTTTELLAHHIAGRISQALRAKRQFCPSYLRVAVDENNGQWGEWIGP
jgi:6-pyruvoyltetrahydropterin/6-carboxytetrahydropterin synthase